MNKSINRTIVELKHCPSFFVKLYPIEYQSYHSGIETVRTTSPDWNMNCINRTIVELKHLFFPHHSCSSSCINRTIVELKLILGFLVSVFFYGINRTIVELKLNSQRPGNSLRPVSIVP